MTVTLTWQSVITAAAILGAVGAIGKALAKAFGWFGKQKKQVDDIKTIKEEQQLLTMGVLACLKGLKEQGCDGPVTDAISKIEEHLNKEAHK